MYREKDTATNAERKFKETAEPCVGKEESIIKNVVFSCETCVLQNVLQKKSKNKAIYKIATMFEYFQHMS